MKAKERILKYGIEAYIKMRGLKPSSSLYSFYKEKYPTAPVAIPATHPETSARQKRYWQKVKKIAEGHGISVKQARKVFKGERKEGRIKLVKGGSGYQLYMRGIYEDDKSGEIDVTTGKVIKKDRTEADGYSYVRATKDYDLALKECIRYAQATLGGSNWLLIKILHKEWYRFYGYERTNFTENHKEE